ncbi:hypothetical protein [Desulfovibrio sp. X2]|uniref:UDP-N-acetylglucosamine 2-epimerase n=1 Tax=Desulfovibrio sp. X2 TaxID=941449 RepID=UPI002E1FA0F3
MRELTERPECIEADIRRFVGTDTVRIVAETTRLLRDPVHYIRLATTTNPFGDGRMSGCIAAVPEGGRSPPLSETARPRARPRHRRAVELCAASAGCSARSPMLWLTPRALPRHRPPGLGEEGGFAGGQIGRAIPRVRNMSARLFTPCQPIDIIHCMHTMHSMRKRGSRR